MCVYIWIHACIHTHTYKHKASAVSPQDIPPVSLSTHFQVSPSVCVFARVHVRTEAHNGRKHYPVTAPASQPDTHTDPRHTDGRHTDIIPGGRARRLKQTPQWPRPFSLHLPRPKPHCGDCVKLQPPHPPALTSLRPHSAGVRGSLARA